MYAEAEKFARGGQYEAALNKLEAAKICNPQEKKYDKLIIEIYKDINQQKENAKREQNKAEKARLIAEFATINAHRAEKEVTIAKDSIQKISDSATTLKNFALAIKHAEKSIAIPAYDSRRKKLKAHLALIAYQLFLRSGNESKKLQTQIYFSLYDAIKSNLASSSKDNFFWNVTSYQEGADHMAYAALARDEKKQSKIYVSAENSRLYSFDLETNTAKNDDSLGKGEVLFGIKASPSGRWMAINTLNQELFLIDNTSGKSVPIKFPNKVRISKFWLDESILYAYNQDSGLYRFHMADGRIVNRDVFTFNIDDLATSNNHIYGLTTSGIVKWDKDKSILESRSALDSSNRENRGTKIRCTPDDSLVVWGNEMGQVFYRRNQSDTAQYLTSFSGPITDIAFDQSGNLVAIASFDKTIRVFNLADLEEDVPLTLDANEGPVSSIFFQKHNEDKESLVAVISPGFIRLYPMDLKTLACKLNTFYTDMQTTIDIDKFVDQAVKNRKVEIRCNP